MNIVAELDISAQSAYISDVVSDDAMKDFIDNIKNN